MVQDFLSNTEYYYTPPELVQEQSLIISGEEVKHISRVMRHEVGDDLYVTDGTGYLYVSKIEKIDKRVIHCSITSRRFFEKQFDKLTVCIPRLKTADRFELAIEKSVELGITDLIIFDAERSLARGDKSERWSKIALAAMKQSLHTHVPSVTYFKNIRELKNYDGTKLVFEQNASITLNEIINNRKKYFSDNSKTFFVFGPEGGLSRKELESISYDALVNMNRNRLRSETAVIAAVAIITSALSK